MRHDDRVWIITQYVFTCKICESVNIVKCIPVESARPQEESQGDVIVLEPEEMEERFPFVVRCKNCKQIYAVQNYHAED